MSHNLLTTAESSTGSILFGGIDTAKFHGGLSVLPIQKSPSDNTLDDFTVALSSISLADASGKTVIVQDDLALPVVLDSGTTLSYLPDVVVNPILSAIGAVNNSDLGPLVPCNFSSSPASLGFNFGSAGGPMINVSFSELILPLYNSNGSQPHFQDGRNACGFGMTSTNQQPYLLGDTFLRSAYAVFDMGNSQIGLAQTNFNTTESNVVEIAGSILPNVVTTASATANSGGAITKSASIDPALTAVSATIDLVGTPTSGGSASVTGKGSGSPTSTSNSAAATSGQPCNHCLSHSAKLGIGLGVSFGIVFLVAVGLLLYRYGRHRERGAPGAGTSDPAVAEKTQPISGGDVQPKFEGDGNEKSKAELLQREGNG